MSWKIPERTYEDSTGEFSEGSLIVCSLCTDELRGKFYKTIRGGTFGRIHEATSEEVFVMFSRGSEIFLK